MNIELGRGFDAIVFGHTERQLLEKLGPADKIFDLDSGDVCYEYNALQVSVNIDPEEDKISWIDIKNKDAKLHEQYIWNKTKPQIIDLFENLLDSKHYFEDYGSMESISFEDHGLELQFELGRLTSINIGYFFDDNDSPIWVV